LDQIEEVLSLSIRIQYSFDIRQVVGFRNTPQGTGSYQSINELLVDSNVRSRVCIVLPLDQKDRRRKVKVGALYMVVGIKV
jgi:hypothetical protein